MSLVETALFHINDLQLEMTSMYCHVMGRDVAPPDQLTPRLHHWNMALLIGLFTAKVCAVIVRLFVFV